MVGVEDRHLGRETTGAPRVPTAVRVPIGPSGALSLRCYPKEKAQNVLCIGRSYTSVLGMQQRRPCSCAAGPKHRARQRNPEQP